jgi:hypothetical protein
MSERGRPRHSNHEKKNRTNEGKGVGREKKEKSRKKKKFDGGWRTSLPAEFGAFLLFFFFFLLFGTSSSIVPPAREHPNLLLVCLFPAP